MTAKLAAAVLAFTATVHGHVVMTEPAPFEYADPNNKQAPLDKNGLDYPCKFPAGFTPKAQAPSQLRAGKEANTLALMGGATHSGGSCQISITSDLLPTKNSKFEVIKSIEGGCPSDAPGNLSNDASTRLPPIKYTIPAGMAPGKYTLAWTWFNKSGNREMYMNCAPVEIGGAASKREVAKISKKRQTGLPTLFMANVGNGCSTNEGSDVTFPDPGQELEKGAGVTAGEPVGSCGAAGAQPAGTASSSAPADPADPSDPTDAADADATPATATDAPVPVSAPAPAPTSPQGAGAATGGAACSPEGTFVCASDGASFTRCASGVMSAPMPMAPGMKCTPGSDSTLGMSAVKRAVRFGVEHVRRSNEAAF